jgi:hypothetical protein
MSDPIKDAYKAEAKTRRKSNGAKRKHTGDPLPGLNVHELIEERNWMALAGLGLIGVGLLYVVFHVLNITFALWAWIMVAGGAWMFLDAWQDYDAAGRIWTGKTRNRAMFGLFIGLIGLFNALRIDWGGLLLLGAGGWLDVYRRGAGRARPAQLHSFVEYMACADHRDRRSHALQAQPPRLNRRLIQPVFSPLRDERIPYPTGVRSLVFPFPAPQPCCLAIRQESDHAYYIRFCVARIENG